jgi:hypothetical protein
MALSTQPTVLDNAGVGHLAGSDRQIILDATFEAIILDWDANRTSEADDQVREIQDRIELLRSYGVHVFVYSNSFPDDFKFDL